MKKQELEELQRLEEELMAADDTEEVSLDEIDFLEDTWLEIADLPVDVYNTDDINVDLDAFSETVAQEKSGTSALPVVLIIILLGVVVFCALKILGVV